MICIYTQNFQGETLDRPVFDEAWSWNKADHQLGHLIKPQLFLSMKSCLVNMSSDWAAWFGVIVSSRYNFPVLKSYLTTRTQCDHWSHSQRPYSLGRSFSLCKGVIWNSSLQGIWSPKIPGCWRERTASVGEAPPSPWFAWRRGSEVAGIHVDGLDFTDTQWLLFV